MTVGEINILLSYVIRKSYTVSGVAPSIIIGKPYFEEHGAVEKDIKMKASNTYPNFKEENSRVYYYI